MTDDNSDFHHRELRECTSLGRLWQLLQSKSAGFRKVNLRTVARFAVGSMLPVSQVSHHVHVR